METHLLKIKTNNKDKCKCILNLKNDHTVPQLHCLYRYIECSILYCTFNQESLVE